MDAKPKNASGQRGVSSLAAGIVLVLVLASACLAVVFAGSLFQGKTAGDIGIAESERERQLEQVRAGVLNENTDGVWFWVCNDGKIDVELKNVVVRSNGTISTSSAPFGRLTSDNRLLSGAYHEYYICNDDLANCISFDAIGITTGRGNLFQIALIEGG